jgi:hypothetical protein
MPIYEYDRAKYSEDPAGSPRAAFVVGAVAGALAGALVIAFVWLGVTGLGSEDPSSDRNPGGQAANLSGGHPSTDEVTDQDRGSTEVARCHEVFAAQRGPLHAASVSLGQWEVHIGAMNKLVTGAITLDQARQFWNQTRVGAATKLKNFDAAQERFQQRTARCPEPSNSVAASLPEMRDCSRAVAARNRALHLAVVSLETWQQHVHHMEMLRRGEMSAQEATRLWLQSWQKGNDEVRAYRAAAQTAKGKAC